MHHLINEGIEKKKGLGRKALLKRKFETSNRGLKDGYWHPPEVRHQDLSKYHIRQEHELPKRD